MSKPFLSICIPVYNNVEKVDRLLNSICIQNYKNFEIILTDDSTNSGVKDLIINRYADLNINYTINSPSKGTPENWNEAIRLAKGDWIKIMHHDDWFENENALSVFADYAGKNNRSVLVYSACNYIDLESNKVYVSFQGFYKRMLMKLSPYILLNTNCIGNPSCTLFKNDKLDFLYNKDLKWLVDIEYYIKRLNIDNVFIYIDQSLINVGMHKEQVTKYSHGNPVIEISESVYFLELHGFEKLKNIFVFDYFWRLIRNLNISSYEQFENFAGRKVESEKLKSIIKFQYKINNYFLQKRFLSKFMMLVSYIKSVF